MALDPANLVVPLDGAAAMRLRPSELEAVAAGLGDFDSSGEGDLLTLAEALRRLPPRDRAPTWELAVRRFAHHKPLARAAGEIGLGARQGRALLQAFTHSLAEVPPPEHDLPASHHPAAELESSPVARVMSAEMLGNAIAHRDPVDLDAAHEASLRAAEEAASERGAP